MKWCSGLNALDEIELGIFCPWHPRLMHEPKETTWRFWWDDGGGVGADEQESKSILDDVATKVPHFERDMCVKEFLALKNCMQTVVVNAYHIVI
ncbi:hypothetical protein Tco_1427760 [Tanacetum coccineum]